MKRILVFFCTAILAASAHAIEVFYTPGQLLNEHFDTLLIRYDPSSGWSHVSMGGQSRAYTLSFDNQTAGLIDGQSLPVHLLLEAELTGAVDEFMIDQLGLQAEYSNFIGVNSARIGTEMGGGRVVSAVLPSPDSGTAVFQFEIDTLATVWNDVLNVAAALTSRPLFIPESVDLVDPSKPAAFEAFTSAAFRIVTAEVSENVTRVPDGGATGLLLVVSGGGLLYFRRKLQR